MKNYLEVTTKYLKSQKKRTILTTIGVIMSVALFSGLFTILYSYRDHVIDEVKKNCGDYEVSFNTLNKEKVDVIKNHTAFSSVGITKNIGFGKIYTSPQEETKNRKPKYRYLNIKAYDDVSLNKIFKPKLLSGRYPKNKNEIIVEKSSLRFLGKDIKEGSKITIPLGMRKSGGTGEEILDTNAWSDDEIFEEKNKLEYTLVGIIDTDFFSSYRNSFSAITSLKTSDIYSSHSKNDEFQSFMSISSPKKKRSIANQVAEELKLVSTNTTQQNNDGENKSKVQFNNELLRLYGQSTNMLKNKSLFLTILFIVSIIIVSTIAVIYNAFNISVLERISQFGILRSIGATPKQIRKIVFKEASTISLIGIPIGIISGVAAIKLVLYLVGGLFIENFDPFKVLIHPQVIIISIILGIITIFSSALGPALLAGRVSPLDAIRNSNNYNTNNTKKVSKAKLSKLLFKIEGSLAYKNLTRNRKRFLITVFSLMISIIMFVTFNSFLNFIKAADTQKASPYFNATYHADSTISEKQYLDIKNQNGVEKMYKCIESHFSMPIPKEKINKDYFNKTQRSNKDESIKNYVLSYNSKLIAYDKSMLDLSKSHIISGSVDKKLLDDMGVILVNRNRVMSGDGSNKTVIEDFTNYKVGDVINLPKLKDYRYQKDFDKILKTAIEKEEFFKLKVVGIIDMEILNNENPRDGIFLITSPKTYKRIIGNLDYSSLQINLKANADREDITSYFENIIKDNGGHFNDYVKLAEDAKKSEFQMSVFVYGFITVISLIGAVNIINTISTSLLIRKREFATLKAIGMSQGQIRKMIFLEGALHGLIASVFGSLLGATLSRLLFKTASGAVDIGWSFPWNSILIATLATLTLTILSSILPLRKVNEQNIIENIRIEE